MGINKVNNPMEDTMTETRLKMEEVNKNKIQVDKMIIKARSVLRLLNTTGRKVGSKSDFTGLNILRGNFLGNFMRGNKAHSVNKNLDRSQKAILDFHRDLLLFDEKLAAMVYLPSKISEYSDINGKIADIAFRTNIRMKELDINKAARSIEKIIRRLEAQSRKYAYEIKKYQELKEL